MKKMIAFFMASFCAMVVKYFTVDDFSALLDFDRIVVVSTEQLCEKYVKNGDDYYNYFSKEEGEVLLKDYENINAKGVNLYFSGKDFDYFAKLTENIQRVDDVEGNACWQGYYSGFKDFRYISKKKINFQLVQTEDGWIMGFPYILTGF